MSLWAARLALADFDDELRDGFRQRAVPVFFEAAGFVASADFINSEDLAALFDVDVIPAVIVWGPSQNVATIFPPHGLKVESVRARHAMAAFSSPRPGGGEQPNLFLTQQYGLSDPRFRCRSIGCHPLAGCALGLRPAFTLVSNRTAHTVARSGLASNRPPVTALMAASRSVAGRRLIQTTAETESEIAQRYIRFSIT